MDIEQLSWRNELQLEANVVVESDNVENSAVNCRVMVPTAPGNYVVKLTGRTATGTAAPALFSIEVTP